MPYLRVRISTTNPQSNSQAVAQMLTKLSVNDLHKAETAVAVDVQFTEPENWFIGGQSLSQINQTSFFVEIKITEGTNTRDEKAAFVKNVFNGMTNLFGEIDHTSYVVLHDVSSDAWGYGGKTQEYRYIANDFA